MFQRPLLTIMLSISVFGDLSKIHIDKNGLAMQSSVYKCISTIVGDNFREGSILGLVSASFHNETNRNLLINTNSIIMGGMMRESRFSIVIKDGRHFQGENEV